MPITKVFTPAVRSALSCATTPSESRHEMRMPPVAGSQQLPPEVH
jgi:hypothetical protein